MDWGKGNSTGNHRFTDEVVDDTSQVVVGDVGDHGAAESVLDDAAAVVVAAPHAGDPVVDVGWVRHDSHVDVEVGAEIQAPILNLSSPIPNLSRCVSGFWCCPLW